MRVSALPEHIAGIGSGRITKKESGSMKKTIDAIDAAKFIGSVLIFTMHCSVLSDYGNVSLLPELIARWGVPFFFLCSAYFLFSKSTDGNIDRVSIRRYLARIGKLYALWFAYNIPSVFYKWFYAKDLSSVGTWLAFLKNAALSSTFTGSWYLLSSMFSAWFVFLLSKKLRTKTILWITSVFYLICVFSSAYSGLLPPKTAEALSLLCFPVNLVHGCFYFALGKYIYENRDAITKILDQRRSAVGFVGF